MLADIKDCTVSVPHIARTVTELVAENRTTIISFKYGQSDSNFPVATDSLLHVTSLFIDRVKHLLSNLPTCL